MLKIALTAGHYLETAGKRCLKSLDKNETREWVLNDRICDKIEAKLKAQKKFINYIIDEFEKDFEEKIRTPKERGGEK